LDDGVNVGFASCALLLFKGNNMQSVICFSFKKTTYFDINTPVALDVGWGEHRNSLAWVVIMIGIWIGIKNETSGKAQWGVWPPNIRDGCKQIYYKVSLRTGHNAGNAHFTNGDNFPSAREAN